MKPFNNRKKTEPRHYREVADYNRTKRALSVPDTPHPSEFGVGLPAKNLARNDIHYGDYRDSVTPRRQHAVLVQIRRY